MISGSVVFPCIPVGGFLEATARGFCG